MSSIRIATLVLLFTGALAAAGQEEIPPFSGKAQDYYTKACASCHGVTGNGRDNSGRALPKTGFDFTDGRKISRRKKVDQEWVDAILNGKGEMPAFKGKLLAQDAQRIITEVLHPFAAH